MIVLSIGTSHPWNVSGTGRDWAVGAQYGARVFTAIAAVSAQDARGVRALHCVPAPIVRAQLEALPWDGAGAARIGALGSAENVRTVVDALRAHPDLPAVVDPVFAASRGGELVDSAARLAIRDELATLPNVILTPNLAEAAEMLGRPITRETIGEAARDLQRRGTLAVLLKGGHLEDDPLDALATAHGVETFSEPRIRGRMHGTGCTLAMALACELAGAAEVHDAVRAARAFVRAEIARH
jgi:hydroxymethylpyrimidine/phosphomethylpyrimidine kinase